MLQDSEIYVSPDEVDSRELEDMKEKSTACQTYQQDNITEDYQKSTFNYNPPQVMNNSQQKQTLGAIDLGMLQRYLDYLTSSS